MSGINYQSIAVGQAVQEHDELAIAKKTTQPNLAIKVVESGTTTYVGQAVIGSATSAAVWRIKKIDESSGAVITWADGNDNADNIMDNAASLTYS